MLKNNGMELKVLDRLNDYTLLERVSDGCFIVAWYMETSGDKCSWASGHYIDNIEDAFNTFYRKAK